MFEASSLSRADLRDWFLVRAENGGVPGEQNGIRSTSNQSMMLVDSDGKESTLYFAESFIGLFATYEGLEAETHYRIVVSYVTPPEEPRVQSLLVNDIEIHGPLRLPTDRVEEFIFDLPAGISRDGKLRVEFVPQKLPEIAGDTEKVGDPPVIHRFELWASVPAPEVLLDAATGPGRTIIVRALELPFMKPILGISASVRFSDREEWALESDGFGNFLVSIPDRHSEEALGDSFVISAEIDGEVVSCTGELDPAFFSSWPLLIPAPDLESKDGQVSYLDSGWEFGVARQAGGPVDSWHEIQVPGQWFQQGFEVPRDALGAYRRKLESSHIGPFEKQFLEFGAVYSRAWVYLEKELICEHEGGFTPFQVEISGVATPGQYIYVYVDCRSVSDKVSAASDYAAHELGGITRDVKIISGPSNLISRFHVEASYHGEGVGKARIFGHIQDGDRSGGQMLDFNLTADDGSLLASFSVLCDGPQFDEEIEIQGVAPWTAETPNLYKINGVLRGSDYAVTRSIGFRSIGVDGSALTVNGSPIRLRGVERHEQHPLLGRRTDLEMWQKDVALMKECNVNNVFTCHYPHPPGFLDLCDREGLWVIDESPTVWVDSLTADSEAEFLNLVRPILEMIERDRSRPSVVVWMLADECSWGRNFWRLVTWLRFQKLQAPLMFSFDTGGDSSLDVASRHYPPAQFEDRLRGVERPVTFDQHTHVNCYNRREIETDPELRDWWGRPMKEMWEAIRVDSRLLGSQVWAWSDDEFHLSSNRVVGYGEWGIVDAWRRRKPEWWNLKMAYCPIRIDTTLVERSDQGVFTFDIENDFDFVSLEEVNFHWQNSNRMGILTFPVPPRSRETVALKIPEYDSTAPVLLSAMGRTGELIGAWEIHEVSQPIPFIPEGGPVVHVSERRAHVFAPNLPEYDGERVRIGPVDWLFDTESGQLKSATLNRHSVIFEGPTLAMIPGHWTQHVGPHHRRGIHALNSLCSNQVLKSVDWDQSGLRMTSQIEYTEALLDLSMSVSDEGGLLVSYRATAKSDVEPRQVGLVFSLPPEFQTISWERESALWSYYPEDHIGRKRGVAAAHPVASRMALSHVPIEPEASWEQQHHYLGSADFRSTKRDILWAQMSDGTGASLLLTKHESSVLHVRAWDSGSHISLLAACHASGGSEPLLARADQHMGSRRFLKAGEAFTGSFRLSIGKSV